MLFENVFGLSEPLVKLVETCSSAIGKIYEPTHIRRIAKAKTDELQILSDAITKNMTLPTKYEGGNITLDTTDLNELAKRTQLRSLYQDMQKQINIESVIAIASNELEKEASVSNEPVDKDWILRFFNSVEDISNEQMQELWGKILAGEIKQPNSFSLRTLEYMKNLSTREAKLFEKISEFIICSHNRHYIPQYRNLWDKFFHFGELVTLEEIGILNLTGVSYEISALETYQTLFNNRELCINYKSFDKPCKFSIKCYKLTEFGIQLLKILNKNLNDEALILFAKALKNDNSNIAFSVHKIIEKNENEILFVMNDLLS